MSWQGFDCPIDNRHVTLKDCVGSCPFPCMEIPMLVNIWGDGPRDRKEERYSVSTMTKPTKAIVLETLNDYWSDPFSMVRMTFGTLYHAAMEGSRLTLAAFGRKDLDFEFERKFTVPLSIDGVPATLVGKPDQYQFSTRTLTDYKGTGTYTYEKALNGDYSGYDVQINLYRQHAYPLAEILQLSFWLTDHSKRQWLKGIRPIERVQVPIIPNHVLDNLVADKIRSIRAGLQDPGALRCTEEERWFGNRCERWCNAAPFCTQVKR